VTATLIRLQIEASIAVKEALLDDEKLIGQIESLAANCVKSLQAGGKVIFAGNGGSFADAQHLSAEFTSRFMFDRAPLASLVLGANNSAISAIGNDYGYDQVFARELKGVARDGDVFVPISTSGNSPNILVAAVQAREQGLVTMALTGAGGGKLAALCDCLCVPSSETARIQECHIMMGHIICGLVEKAICSGEGR
jgi:D-sedoheptulose 7-phosphate isomerase